MKHGPSFNIVFEWEDIIAKELGLNIRKPGEWAYALFYWRIETFHLTSIYNKILKKKDLSLQFIMQAGTRPISLINKNTIPVIIDFWLEEKDLDAFYKAYRNVPLILVTNREVYDFLKENSCPLPVEHWALSFPDQYALSPHHTANKEYDFCIFGRPNPFFIRLLEEYCHRHPEFKYIRNNGDINHRQYIDNRGNVIAEDAGRESYLEMIRRTKISCYTTPGIDEAKSQTTRYNQVTPRLFEMLCNGCQVIGHYPDTADVNWYGIRKIVPNVNSYEEFETALDKLRTEDFHYEDVHQFMQKHYTSSRIPQLIDILKKYNIEIA